MVYDYKKLNMKDGGFTIVHLYRILEKICLVLIYWAEWGKQREWYLILGLMHSWQVCRGTWQGDGRQNSGAFYRLGAPLCSTLYTCHATGPISRFFLCPQTLIFSTCWTRTELIREVFFKAQGLFRGFSFVPKIAVYKQEPRCTLKQLACEQ